MTDHNQGTCTAICLGLKTGTPFAYAIAVTGPGLSRAHWLSGSGVTDRRIHAECWPDRASANSARDSVARVNGQFSFEVRTFDNGDR